MKVLSLIGAILFDRSNPTMKDSSLILHFCCPVCAMSVLHLILIEEPGLEYNFQTIWYVCICNTYGAAE